MRTCSWAIWAPLLFAVVAVTTETACAGRINSRIQVLEQRESTLGNSVRSLEVQQTNLDRMILAMKKEYELKRNELAIAKREAEQSRGEAEGARADAAYHQCMASRERHSATRERIRALEIIRAADYAGCLARHAKSQKEYTAIGCLVGILVIKSPAFCGASVVVSSTMQDSCGTKPAKLDEGELTRQALFEDGLSQVPVCYPPSARR